MIAVVQKTVTNIQVSSCFSIAPGMRGPQRTTAQRSYTSIVQQRGWKEGRKGIASPRYSVELPTRGPVKGGVEVLRWFSGWRIWFPKSLFLLVSEHTFLSSPPSQVCRWLSERWVIEKVEVKR